MPMHPAMQILMQPKSELLPNGIVRAAIIGARDNVQKEVVKVNDENLSLKGNYDSALSRNRMLESLVRGLESQIRRLENTVKQLRQRK